MHAQCMVVATFVRTGKLCHLTGVIEQVMDMTNNIITLVHIYEEFRLKNHPWHFLQTQLHRLVNFINSFKVVLDSSTPREGPIPNFPIPFTQFFGTNNQEVPTIFTLLRGTRSRTQNSLTPSIPKLRYTHYINP